MADMLYQAMKYMNGEDAMIAKGGGLKKWKKHDNPYLDKGRKAAWTSDKRDEWRSRPLPGRMANFTLLNTLLN